MSIVPKETIEVIAQSIGISNLSPDVLPALAADVEYRIREIMQEAIKCMRHSKRTTLSTDDVDSALTLRNVEPIYGFASGDPLRFRRAAGHKDLFYIEEKDVEFKDVIEAPLPKAPLDTALFAHWLAIEGVQPAIPENPPLEALAPPADNRKSEYKEDGVPVDLKIPVKHVLSRELQLYYDKITELTVNKSNSPLFKEALASLATDPGLHPLVPYFTYFVADEVARNLNNFDLLFALMRLVWSLLQNSHLHIEPYLHQSMPSVMTCLVAKRLGNKFSDNHWQLRDFTAKLVALICRRYGHVYHSLQPRITKTLLHAYLDPTKALPQHYGAIQGLAALGSGVVRLLVLPNLEAYLRLLEPEMQLEKQKNEMKRHEAWRVYGALMSAAGLCMYEHFKMLPASLSPSNWIFLKNKCKVATTLSNKRKASMDDMISQPPPKKLMTDGPASPMLSSSLPVGIQGAIGGNATTLGVTDASLSSGPQGLQNENANNGMRSSRREIAGGKIQKAPAAFGQASKKDMDAANLLPPLFEYFGDNMLFFAPSPELSFFL
ncbi:transcription initiation factor TFIID subunit 6-like isoform X1 [Nicotiana sylvestris]|uniref:Transcription initiation factor TFIID subunit 6-like isoform X1 n=1 Tax=Nicotiana sylvestris TaxID=4096 RepID=A0A1U7VRR9_NICSY|nr:PREDICTED: transcription initiation factor TFIID subunit 6-like isoform X1 [Nicotiana sylvestris]